MPDDATVVSGASPAPSQSATAATPAPAQAVQESVNLTPEAIQAGFTAEDFNNPQYGVKAKNLYKGFQSASEERATLKRQIDELKQAVQTDPDLRSAVEKYQRRLRGEKVDEPNDSTPDDLTPEKVQEQMEAKMALQSIYASLGKGDPLEGQKVFEGEYYDDVDRVFKVFRGKSSPSEQLRFALEVAQLMKAKNNPAVQPAPQPAVATAGESGRGTSGSPVDTTPSKTVEDDANKWAKSMGFASIEAWAQAQE